MVNLVMILNLIIAIFTNIYSVFEPKSLALYYDGVIESIPMFRYSKSYGSLICGQPPFNAIVFFFLPGFWFMDCTEKTQRYNELLLHILYFPIGLISTLCFLAFSLILMPFAYIAAIMFKINNFFKELQLSKTELIFEILIFTIFGPLFLIISYFVDAFFFVKEIYLKVEKKPSNYKGTTLSVKTMLTLHRHTMTKRISTLEDDNGNKTTSMVEFVNQLRD